GRSTTARCDWRLSGPRNPTTPDVPVAVPRLARKRGALSDHPTPDAAAWGHPPDHVLHFGRSDEPAERVGWLSSGKSSFGWRHPHGSRRCPPGKALIPTLITPVGGKRRSDESGLEAEAAIRRPGHQLLPGGPRGTELDRSGGSDSCACAGRHFTAPRPRCR